MSHSHEPLVLAKIDLVSLYFRLLWYHSILRGSIDQKHAKSNEIWRQNSEIHSAFACSHWPPWLPDLFKPYGACVKRGNMEAGNICLVSVFFVRVGKKDSNIPSPGRTRSIKCPTPGPTKTNPHPMPCPPPHPPPPAGLTIIGALTE